MKLSRVSIMLRKDATSLRRVLSSSSFISRTLILDRVAGLSFLLDGVQQLDAFVADEHRPRHCDQTFDFGLTFAAARTVERLVDHLVPPKKKTYRSHAITFSLNAGD
jgi:hypothetical protein